ncbi:MAG: hypothetical protein JWR87_1646 [Segetibacter sp.]|nr:hypothetical protein [Segetibacter sp.]
MGFGTKTDLATGRKLNLDLTYHKLIKPVIESKGLLCVRADEIRHAGIIDVPMYRQLLSADVVVADISTANANAFYELGVRHAMRPRTTIVISEQQMCYPFDLNHILITKYSHLGENIDYPEVLRFQKVLSDTLDAVLKIEDPDSPVYTFLSGLIPPKLQQKAEEMAQQVGAAIKNNDDENPNNRVTLAVILKEAEDALKSKEYETAKVFLNSAIKISNCKTDPKLIASNSYLFHRLALATYKAEKPDKLTALHNAIDILDDLDLQHTNDAETVTLAAKIEKRLFFKGQGEDHLANAIQYYERAYFLLNNRYNAINLAFLIDNRVDTNLYPTVQDKIADMILANRIREVTLKMCEQDWKKYSENASAEKEEVLQQDNELAKSQQAIENEQKFWILVNRAEAYFGLGNKEAYLEARKQAQQIEHKPWMMEVFNEQVEKLEELINKYGHFLSAKETV